MRAACKVLDVLANIQIRKTVRMLVRLSGRVVTLEFPETVYTSSGLGVYLLCEDASAPKNDTC